MMIYTPYYCNEHICIHKSQKTDKRLLQIHVFSSRFSAKFNVHKSKDSLFQLVLIPAVYNFTNEITKYSSYKAPTIKIIKK